MGLTEPTVIKAVRTSSFARFLVAMLAPDYEVPTITRDEPITTGSGGAKTTAMHLPTAHHHDAITRMGDHDNNDYDADRKGRQYGQAYRSEHSGAHHHVFDRSLKRFSRPYAAFRQTLMKPMLLDTNCVTNA